MKHDFLYFDQAATSFPKPSPCIEQMKDFLSQHIGTIRRRGYATPHTIDDMIDQTRQLIRSLISSSPDDQIIFTASATEAVNMILQGFLKEGDHVITSSFEHSSVSRTLTALSKRKKVEFSIIRPNSSGIIDLNEVQKVKRPNTKMLAFNYGSNVTGEIVVADDIGLWAKQNQIAYFLDVSQSMGSYPIDVSNLQPDFMAFSGHKSLLGPTGVGCLYMRKGLTIPLFRYGGTGYDSAKDWIEPTQASDYETGTQNVVGIIGLKASLEFIQNSGLEKFISHKHKLTSYFLSKIRNIDNIQTYVNSQKKRLPIVSFNIKNANPQLVAQLLDHEYQIITRAGLQCSPWAHKEIGTFPRGTIRTSFGYFHTYDCIDRLVKAIKDICQKLKGDWLC